MARALHSELPGIAEALGGLGARGSNAPTWLGGDKRALRFVSAVGKQQLQSISDLTVAVDVVRLQAQTDALGRQVVEHLHVGAALQRGNGGLSVGAVATHEFQRYPLLAAAAKPIRDVTTPVIAVVDPAAGLLTAGFAIHETLAQVSVDVAQLDPGLHEGALGSLPVGTFLFSGARELKLLRQDDTDRARAAKNVVLDMFGGKLGVIVGGGAATVLAAPGVVAVGAAAAVGFAGREAARKIRLRPLTKAERAFAAAEESFGAELNATREAIVLAYAEHQQAVGKGYSAALSQIEDELQRLCDDAAREIASTATLDRAQAERLLADGERTLERIGAHDGDARAWRAAAAALRGAFKASRQTTERTFDLLLALPDGEPAARAHIARVHAGRKRGYQRVAEGVRRVGHAGAAQHGIAVTALERRRDQLLEEAARRMEEPTAVRDRARELHQSELRKAGRRKRA